MCLMINNDDDDCHKIWLSEINYECFVSDNDDDNSNDDEDDDDDDNDYDGDDYDGMHPF